MLRFMKMGPDGLEEMEDPEASPTFDAETARQLLSDSYLKLQEWHSLKPGEIIKPKVGLNAGVVPLCGGLAVFIAYDPCDGYRSCDPGDQTSHAQMDCIIGRLTDDGAMYEVPACSRYYEPA